MEIESSCAQCGAPVFQINFKLYTPGRSLVIVDGKVEEIITVTEHKHWAQPQRELEKRRLAIKMGYDLYYAAHENPMNVECPKCGAQPDHRCENMQARIKFRLAYTASPHKERVDAQLKKDGMEFVYDDALRDSFLRKIK